MIYNFLQLNLFLSHQRLAGIPKALINQCKPISSLIIETFFSDHLETPGTKRRELVMSLWETRKRTTLMTFSILLYYVYFVNLILGDEEKHHLSKFGLFSILLFKIYFVTLILGDEPNTAFQHVSSFN